ncbi:hypothetical protein QBC34DRAFT_457252 [Podospora aff. communis PSN243]|uniref:Protein NO VEIN C-terminal domain-containing protein n=1 Tax=Podospora aff. communis PSN243 TaxID=3040156 RepID=A0AAV9GTK0_9PEZI|nr:hypothetical protein QBC34DRAFT_457252 [Podospora aff. communis PSN243]
MAQPTTPAAAVAAARELIESIASDHGHLADEVYSGMDPATRRRVKEALDQKDQLIGSTVMFASFFELLQNADDNSFQRVTAAGHEAYLAFCVYHDRIIVDCNEDGFDEANIRTICIGFKSVFKVAWKVHIQSGRFSLCFKHRPGDSGMGMISPQWLDAEALSAPVTRMTFTLHDDGDGDDGNVRAAQRKSIADELEQLQSSMMLFLKNIKRIEVRFFDRANTETKSFIMTRSGCAHPNRAILDTLWTTKGADGKHEVERSKMNFHLTRTSWTGLARNENRTFSPAEEISRAYSKAEVVLAFPLDENSVPLDQSQSIFAFLPVRQVGFNFLIHSDFVTNANREDIVTSSLRNEGIRTCIALSFVTAAKEMCRDSWLRFQWMRFLPALTGNHINDIFWGGFVNHLKEALITAEVMIPYLEKGPLRTIGQVKTFPSTPSFLDQHGRPLSDDLSGQAGLFISKCYKDSDLDLLTPYGLGPLSIEDMANRLSADLEQKTSKMRSSNTDHDWHSRAARLVKHLLCRLARSHMQHIMRLRLLPLDNKEWTSVDGCESPIYLPTSSNGTEIPPGLDLRLISAGPAADPDRKRLFLALGVKSATDNDIRLLVLEQYETKWPQQEESVAWLRFLYLTQLSQPGSTAGYEHVSIVSWAGENCDVKTTDVYFPDDTCQYGAAKLSLDVNFLHPDFLKDPPAISDEVLHVAQHLPGKLLGLGCHLWPYEGNEVLKRDAIRGKFSEMEVLCEGGRKYPLRSTILPTAALKSLSARFLRENEHLPFLNLKNTCWDEKTAGFEFLEILGVQKEESLKFYIGMLRYIATQTPDASMLKDWPRLLGLYKSIHGLCIASNNIEQVRKAIRSEFNGTKMIYVPKSNGHGSGIWASPETCLLDAPADFKHKVPAAAAYNQASDTAAADLGIVNGFFRDTLAIPRLSWRDYIAELTYLRDNKINRCSSIEMQYRRLKDVQFNANGIGMLRELFNNNNLIYYVAGDRYFWCHLSHCLWSPGNSVQGRFNLAQVYDNNLEPFFVDRLQVTRLTVDLVYGELLIFGDRQTPIQDGAISNTLAPGPLLEKNLLPIKHPDGKVLLLPPSAGFTIIDRAGTMAQFRGVVKTLDFTMDEVHALEPFLKWMGLEHRYLSRMVEEMPALGSGKKVRVSEPRYNLRKKAHGLFRVAKYFRSPKYSDNGQALYDLLRKSETCETDIILTQFTITIDNKTRTIQRSQGDVYLYGGDGTLPLTVFIPQDERAQDICVQHSLPRELVKWFMADPKGKASQAVTSDKAVGVVKGLLNARLSSVASILTQEGIHEVDVENEDVEDTASSPSRSRSTSPATPEGVFTPTKSSAVVDTPMTDAFATPSGSFFSGSYPPVSRQLFGSTGGRGSRDPQSPAADNLYRELLDHMIRTGQRVEFPDQSVLGASQVSTELAKGSAGGGVSSACSSASFSNFQLGAAGELFVFEMLKKLGSSIPGFCWPNWMSAIKKEVKVHPDYATAESWGDGIEEADLQYSDTSGSLTALLISKGHLEAETWTGKRSHYHFEVKSTPRHCSQPFYMSGLQYRKMIEMNTEGQTSVYIIFRLFNMFTDKINVKLYVDPAELERQGELDF